VEHDDGVICGGFITGDDFFDTYVLVVEFSVHFFALSMPMQPVSTVASYLLIWELESRGLFCPSKVLLMTARLAETAL